MIPQARLLNHQLVNPLFNDPAELVKWMGAVQAQDYTMTKWAIGMRLQTPSLKAVNQAIEEGRIVRTHIMRPTWHLVPGEDLRWMLKLSAQRIRSSWESYAKGKHGISPDKYILCNDLIIKLLEENHCLTKQELAREFVKAGIIPDTSYVNLFTVRAEVDGIVCSGADKGKEPTYALLEKQVPVSKDLTIEEALLTIAQRYFRSHAPAGLQDFVWWSGLTVTEAKKAIALLNEAEGLTTCKYKDTELYLPAAYTEAEKYPKTLQLLPSYDEYLISYKDRSAVLPQEHVAKAHNNYGIFYPVIVYNGQVVGNWKKVTRKKEILVETSFFDSKLSVPQKLLKQAIERYTGFLAE
ncbi:MAG: winged helix DNA-binding domain-containing protein [Tannerellaceae bacterium]|nr:winged helix DNA-binding domain-containing protein [Tannerellaceae bacterium]